VSDSSGSAYGNFTTPPVRVPMALLNIPRSSMYELPFWSRAVIEEEKRQYYVNCSELAEHWQADPRIDILVAKLAAHYGANVCVVALECCEKMHFISKRGLYENSTYRPASDILHFSLFHHHIARKLPIIIKDLRQDERVKDHPFVTGVPELCFYASAPLVVPGKQSLGILGTLTIGSSFPRDFFLDECDLLISGAAEVVKIIMEYWLDPEIEPIRFDDTSV